ncbi:hypothetical protein [Methanothermobacter sp.]|uniref:hypothetical protein n=1 Tax=Methanothermobacter sp. TaxID=1884223 RepID=UPI003C725AD4
MFREIHREKLYLAAIAILAFIVRLIPSRTLSLAGKDAYIHHDIAMRIFREGPGIIAHDIPSLMGLKAYAYPPLFHLIGSGLYMIFQSDIVFFLIGPLFGTAAVIVIYRVALEISGNKETALLSAFLFSMVPSFITRTSIFIPESMGILLTSGILYMIVRYLKTIPGYPDIDKFELKGFLNLFRGDLKYILGGLIIFGIYLFTHRGWVFLLIALLLLAVTFLTPSFRKRPIEFGLIFILVGVGIFEFITFAARFQSVPVTILGFPKWMGVLQLILGIYGALILLRSKNPIHRFLIIWAAAFMIIGTYSFRFRDPYAAIPLSLIAGYGLSEVRSRLNGSESLRNYRLLKWNIGALIQTGVFAVLLLVPVAQGAAIAYTSVVTPTTQQKAAFTWIEDNTPADAVFLSSTEDSYLLIGNTHRKDVLLWKTVYEGFMGDSPSLKENSVTHDEVSAIFDSSLPSEAHYLIEKNNISYIYLSKSMHERGIGLYIPVDPHFKTCFVSGDVSIYRYIKNPELQSNCSKMAVAGEYSNIVEFIEKFWNGYSYSEAGGTGYTDPAEDLEFGNLFKGSYDSNAMIAALYLEIGNKSGDRNLTSRGEYLLEWLRYKQMDNGSFPGGMPPAEYTLTTMQTVYPLMEIKSAASQEIVNSGLLFVDSQVKGSEINVSPLWNAPIFPGDDYLRLKTESQVAGMYPSGKAEIIHSLIEGQGYDGSWSSKPYENIGILKGLALYYISTKDPKVLDSIKKGSEWLKTHQNPQGSFQGDGEDHLYCVAHYSDAALIYSVAGDKASLERTLGYIERKGFENDPTPLRSFLTFIQDMKIIYGDDRAMQLADGILKSSS